jgi:BirA family biotin operon repressor/biotin-[acetyl-CoA-carboxylase] ligase
VADAQALIATSDFSSMPAAAKKRTSKSPTQARRARLLALLATGEFHSGERLAKRLRISRGGIWKLIHSLQALGVDIESVPRQGYRLPRAVDLLDRNAILAQMSAESRALVDPLEVLLTVDSTNRYVAEHAANPPGRTHICVAEIQNAGRGRRGRSWVAPFGCGICMSLGWQFLDAPPTFSALSLAVGVAAVRAFRRLRIEGVGLKWPNDLIWQQRKLGGILIEMRGESAGPAQVVIGIGINVRMPATVRLMLAEQQAALISDVHEIMRERAPPRNELIATLAEEVTKMLQTFGERGFGPFAEEWRRLDTLADAPVRVMSGAETTFGRARGVELDGTLLVDVDGELRRFASGEVSLRPVRSG